MARKKKRQRDSKEIKGCKKEVKIDSDGEIER